MRYFSLTNIFWYFLAYGVVTFILMRFMSSEKRKKILTYTIQGSFIEKTLALLSLISRNAMMIISLFIPIYSNLYFIFIGNILYFAGLILATISMWQFSREEINKPITWGLYRISRNPMQVMSFIMGIGIALIANNIWLWVLTIINIASSYPMFFMQEKYCIEKYGKAYADYMLRTPRILFFKTSKKHKEM
jgi:protein-S-isoprenylcysteine O-methyltransferase Ste14